MAKGIKTGGREKGTPNKTTKEVRSKFEEIINSFDAESLIKDIERPYFFEKILYKHPYYNLILFTKKS